jgi:hypothetical protein
VSIWPQRLADVTIQRIDDDLLAPLTEARVPRRRLVKQRATIDIAFDVPARAPRDIGNAHVTNIASVATSAILQALPDIQKKLYRKRR